MPTREKGSRYPKEERGKVRGSANGREEQQVPNVFSGNLSLGRRGSTGQGVFLLLVKGSRIIFVTYCSMVTQILVQSNCQEPVWSAIKQQNDGQNYICSCAYGSAHSCLFIVPCYHIL